ncbi:hypothetical protein NECAME_13483 [Necator americanus]|uniref:Uncharacterized protein n=1 Tax=Necator americanus TaxID=51031 RepID=W2SV84_NECAM|nr:hypothetical protein NECAME_13483 [Necator americanus]ETN73545.1 hypothetical protein NECAME_13483 [Necator americanus]
MFRCIVLLFGASVDVRKRNFKMCMSQRWWMRLVLSLLLLVAVSWIILDVADARDLIRQKRQYYGGAV